MTALAWLIPAALVLGLFGLIGFLWTLKSGQYEDLEGAAWRAIQDDDDVPATDTYRNIKHQTRKSNQE